MVEVESRDSTVVRALAPHQCGPGSIPVLGVICGLSLLLVLVPRGGGGGTNLYGLYRYVRPQRGSILAILVINRVSMFAL